MTLDTQTAKPAKPNAKPIDGWQEAHDAWHSAQAATKKAQESFDLAVVEARAAIAALDVPWTVRGVVGIGAKQEDTLRCPPPVGNLTYRGPIGGIVARPMPVSNQISLDPIYVCFERFEGIEHRIVAYPTARDENEARRLASAECQAAAEAHQEAVAAIVERCRIHAAYEVLRAAKEAERWARYRI